MSSGLSRGGAASESFLLVVHAGAGRRSRSSARETGRLLRRILDRVVVELPLDAKASDVVVAAVSHLENSPLTNAGVGSSLNMAGRVECDAVVCCSDGSVGAVGAVEGVRNPVALANRLRVSSLSKGPCGLINPVLMSGPGAREWAQRDGVVVEPDCHVTTATRASWQEYVDRVSVPGPVVSDTVGAVCLDVSGNIAAAASSGGNWLKPSGRLGAAAVPNCSVAVTASCGVAASGIGERMISESFALRCALDLAVGGAAELDRLAISCAAGMISVLHQGGDNVEVVVGHATESFCFGYYSPSSMPHPVCKSSSGKGDSCIVEGFRVRPRSGQD